MNNPFPVIHALRLGKLTVAEIAKEANYAYQSSKAILLRLIDEGLVDSETVGREPSDDLKGDKRQSAKVYFLKFPKWKTVVQIYFPSQGEIKRRAEKKEHITDMKQKAEFLASSYADQIFGHEQFYELLMRLFLRWAVDMDYQTFDKFKRADRQLVLRDAKRIIPEEWHELITLGTKAIDRAIDLTDRMKRGNPQTKQNLESDVKSLLEFENDSAKSKYYKKMVLSKLGFGEKDIEELATLIRLSPSLVGYMAFQDNKMRIGPFEILFDSSKTPRQWPPEPFFQELNKFIWRFIMIMVVHDIVTLPKEEVDLILKKANVSSLQPYLQHYIHRAFNDVP